VFLDDAILVEGNVEQHVSLSYGSNDSTVPVFIAEFLEGALILERMFWFLGLRGEGEEVGGAKKTLIYGSSVNNKLGFVYSIIKSMVLINFIIVTFCNIILSHDYSLYVS